MDKFDEIITLFPNRFATDPKLSVELLDKLRLGGETYDCDFDKIFPPYYQLQSTMHWTPIFAASQIADWIKPLGLKSIVDIGCGVGKLCILLRVLTDYKILGIEQRPKLVRVANKIIEVNELKNVSIVQMNMLDLDWAAHDIYYLYNPFQEHLDNGAFGIIENDLEFDHKNFVHYTSEVFKQLCNSKRGKILITFHGYGGSVPSDWSMVASRHLENGDLTMWIKD